MEGTVRHLTPPQPVCLPGAGEYSFRFNSELFTGVLGSCGCAVRAVRAVCAVQFHRFVRLVRFARFHSTVLAVRIVLPGVAVSACGPCLGGNFQANA